jgi:integrase
MARKRANNEGSIWKEGQSWRAAVTLDGRRISHSFQSKPECRAWINDMQSQITRGMTYASAQLTLKSYLQKWLDTHKLTLGPKTAPRYEQITRDYIIPALGEIKLSDLRLDVVEAHYQTLTKKGLSSRSVRFVHMILHKSLNDAIRRGYLSRNPIQGAILPRRDQKEMQILDEDEVMRFLIVVQDNRREALYNLAVKTGMRQGELLALKWSDLDWKRSTIRVQRQVQRIPGKGMVFRFPKTRSSRRAIQLGEQTLDTLRNQLTRLELEKAVAGERWQEHNLIFPSTVGTPMGSSNLHKDFKKQLQKAKLRDIRFHDLRHTAASLMLNHGVPVLVVSKILGHSKTSTTLDVYGHLIPVMQEQAARIMDEVITPIPVNFGGNIEEESIDNDPRCTSVARQ